MAYDPRKSGREKSPHWGSFEIKPSHLRTRPITLARDANTQAERHDAVRKIAGWPGIDAAACVELLDVLDLDPQEGRNVHQDPA